MSPDFIMSHLQWMENLFQMYLRDTGMIQDKQKISSKAQEVPDLIAGPHQTAPKTGPHQTASKIRSTHLPMVDANNTMGNYADEFD